MSLTLDDVLAQEASIELKHFNNETAWQLGCELKQAAEQLGAAVAIEVYGFGQVLFQYAMPGTAADKFDWVRRKRNSVLKYNHSTYYLSLYNAQKQREFEAQLHVDANEYCGHGGSFPIRIKGSGLVGALTVSGLPQEADHQLVADALQRVLSQQ